MKLSLLFPCKDQSERLLENLKNIVIPYFDKQNIEYEIMVCLDGSNEEQLKIFDEGKDKLGKEVIVTEYQAKRGKGHNVQRLILECHGEYCLFMDADLATDLSVFPLMAADFGKYDCYVGSRNAKGSVYEKRQTIIRQLMHFVSRKLIKMKFHLKDVKDTQCGFKMLRTEVGRQIAQRQIIDGFAFDVEYLYFLTLNGYKIHEYPVIWKDNPASSISNARKEAKEFTRQLKLIKKNKDSYILPEGEKL